MTKHKRNWNKIKGYRDPSPAMPVLIAKPDECVLVHNGKKLSFRCDLPLDEEPTWESVHGKLIDDRVRPPLPQGFEPLRPLKKPNWRTFYEAKKTAFAVLKQQRKKAHSSNQFELFGPRGNVA